MKIRSFRQKILLALVGTVAILTTLTLLVMSFFIRGEIMRKTEADLAKTRAAFREQQLQHLNMLRELGSRLAGSQRLAAAVEEGDADVVAGVLDNEQEISRLRGRTFVAITDRAGNALARGWSGQLTTQSTTTTAEQEFIARNQAGAGAGQYLVSDDQILEAFCLAMHVGDQRLGTIIVAFPVTDETAAELAVATHDVEVGFLLGDRIVASTLPTPARAEAERRLQYRGQKEHVALQLDGAPYAAFVTRLTPEGAPAFQVILVSQRSLQRLLASLRNGALACGAMTLAACVWISAGLARGISAPVAELESGTRQIRAGNLAVRITPRTADELGRLAEAFNEMTEGLQLKEKYRGVLDKVVSPEVGEELLSGKIELGGELRSVTVLFSDIRGFTALTEGMKPRDVLEMLNRHMTAMTEIIRRHSGIVDKFAGDEIIAVFGAPKSNPNDARAALRAATEMRDAQRQMNRAGAFKSLEIGLGINTGEVVAGNMGSDKQISYTVLGATVNLAARLCQSAGPMQILASETSIAAASAGFVTNALEPIAVKGFSKPIQVFEVIHAT